MHLIEETDQTYSVKGTEWHKKAHHVQSIDESTIAPIIQTPIIEKQMFVADFDEKGAVIPGSLNHMSGYKAICADLTARTDLPEYLRQLRPLHVPKNSYRIISNAEIWDCVLASLKDVDGAKIITAGTLGNCAKFYLSVEFQGESEFKTDNGDKFQSILNFLSSHDGTLTFTTLDSMTRTVCFNTFSYNAAYEGSAFKASIPHTKNAGIQIQNLSEYLNAVFTGRRKIIQSMSYLETLTMQSPSQSAYVASSFFTDNEAKEMSTTSYNKANSIRDLSIFGKGNAGKTRADMFNGFTEFYTHHEGAGGKKADSARRWSASIFGTAATHKENFLGVLLDETEFSHHLQRGEKLYSDKHQALMA
jgi:hypothetical protein